MLESGLAVIVACLPSFQSLFRTISPEAIFQSILGIISLRTFGSRSSAASKQSAEDRSSLTRPSLTGPAKTNADKPMRSRVETELHPLRDLEAQYGLRHAHSPEGDKGVAA